MAPPSYERSVVSTYGEKTGLTIGNRQAMCAFRS